MSGFLCISDVHAQDSTATQLNNLVETGTLQWNDGKTRLSNARPLTESLFPNVPPTIHFVSEQAQENLPGNKPTFLCARTVLDLTWFKSD